MSAPEAWHVTRTVRVLELLARRPRSATEVAEAVSVHPRTARRLLNRLLAEGYVRRTAPRRGKYGITMKLVAVGQHALEHAELLREAVPHVERLRAEADARAHLSVASYRSALRLIDESRERSVSARAQVGESVPCHCSASGHVLLAYRQRWCDSVLMGRLEIYTDHTLVEPEGLKERLEVVRMRGYAVEHDEFAEGVGSVAAPVYDHTGEAIAALGVSVQSAGLESERLSALVVLAAGRLSARLGHAPGVRSVDDGPSQVVLDMVPAARSFAS